MEARQKSVCLVSIRNVIFTQIMKIKSATKQLPQTQFVFGMKMRIWQKPPTKEHHGWITNSTSDSKGRFPSQCLCVCSKMNQGFF